MISVITGVGGVHSSAAGTCTYITDVVGGTDGHLVSMWEKSLTQHVTLSFGPLVPNPTVNITMTTSQAYPVVSVVR